MDQLNFTLSLDVQTAEKLNNLAPHKSTFDLNKPRKVATNLSMPKPVVSTISNWITYSGVDTDPVKREKMMALLCT